VLQHADDASVSLTRVLKSVSNGKHKLDLKLRSEEHIFRLYPGRYNLRLLVGHPGTLGAVDATVAHITLAYPPLPMEERVKMERRTIKDFAVSADDFHWKPEIRHKFREAERMPPTTISAAFSLLCLAPWLLLLALWTQLRVNVDGLSSSTQTTFGAGFILSLAGIAFLYYLYWTRLTLLPTLAYLLALGVVAAVTGRKALSEIAQIRVKSPKKE